MPPPWRRASDQRLCSAGHSGLPGARRRGPGDDSSTVTVVSTPETDRPATVEPAALLQVAADPVRWTVLSHLSTTPCCVCEIQEQVGIAPSLLSYHLKVLREAGLVTATRRGRWIDYALAPGAHERLVAGLPTLRAGDGP